jgi:hypothetical protein
MEVLSARFGPNPFMSAILGSLDLTKVQPAYILSHPEVFDDAIMESAKKANDENVSYKNFLGNTIEYHLKDQVRQWIMQKGVQIAASGVFMMLGNLFSMVKLPKFNAKEVHGPNLNPGAIHAVPNRPLGLGITANVKKRTTLPRKLQEQHAIEEAMANPSAGRVLDRINMSAPRWRAEDGWVKMERKIQSNGKEGDIIVHYVFNTLTGAIDDFKIVLSGAR